MKRLLIGLTAALMGSQVYAQEVSTNGDILLGNGKSTVQIRIGNRSANNVQLTRRVRRLERAVRDLQDIVYDLQSAPVVTDYEYTCRLQGSWNTYTAKGVGSTQQIAEDNAREAVMSKCRSKESFASSCKEDKIKKCYQSK